MTPTRQDPTAAESSPNEHHSVWGMLPWIANGSATQEQQTQAATHLERCADCRAELRMHQQLQRALQGQAPSVRVEPEEGLQRLLGRIDAPPQEQPVPAPPQRKRSPLLVAMAAAIAMQAVGLGVLGVQHGTEESGEFRVLSQGDVPLQAATLRVVPSASMTMAEWQSLLQSLELRVVGGPNTMGAYLLAPAPAAAVSATEQLARLRQTAGVRLAEPMTP